jgi:predicted phosphoribosyltransferase
LQLPLDVLVVHKIAAPAHPAKGLAAVAEPGHVVVNQPAVHQAALSDAWVAEAVAQGISAVSHGRAPTAAGVSAWTCGGGG